MSIASGNPSVIVHAAAGTFDESPWPFTVQQHVKVTKWDGTGPVIIGP